MNYNHYDVAVVGTGPGGYVAAIRAAQLGLKVVAIEREHFGGICLNYGCIPTKSMLRSSELLHLMRRSEEFGISVDSVVPNLTAIVDRSRKIANQLNSGVEFLLKKNKVETIMGTATINDTRKLTITTDNETISLSADNIIIATGARARELPDIKVDGDFIWSYKHALIPPRMPKSLLIVGSGAIGVEFANFYNSLGAKTTIVELMPNILPVEDVEISAIAHKQFEKQGIRIFTKAHVTELVRNDDGLNVTITSGDTKITDHFDTVISAVGITGNTENLGLEELGIKVEKSHIVTDTFCRTAVGGVYAIGDVTGAPWLAHKASHEGVMVAELIAGMLPHPVKPENIAGCTYSIPQIASVGLTEEAAKICNREIRIGRFPFIGNGKALALGEPDGMIKTIFDAATGELLGAHMVGAEVTELIQGFVVARTLETTEEELFRSVFPHPTLSEMMHESALQAYGRAIHI